MLDEEERRDLREGARCESLVRDCETLRRNSRPADPKNIDLDAYMRFLTDFGRIFPQPASRPLITGKTFLI